MIPSLICHADRPSVDGYDRKCEGKQRDTISRTVTLCTNADNIELISASSLSY